MKIKDIILKKISTISKPTYIYDLPNVQERCDFLSELQIDHKRIFFAMMANDSPTVIKTISDSGHGIFVNSIKHMDIALDNGIAADSIIFAASNMTETEMMYCNSKNVHMILDSLTQLQNVGCCKSKDIEVGIRVNVAHPGVSDLPEPDETYRFGINPSDLGAAIEMARAAKVRITGLHCYFGTNHQSFDILVRGIKRLLHLADKLPHIQYIDAGGGFGISAEIPNERQQFLTYETQVHSLMSNYSKKTKSNLSLFLEPGRYLVADSGYYAVNVIDIKINSEQIFIGTDGSIPHFPRALVYPESAHHPCVIVRNGRILEGPPCEVPVFICGNSTYSHDFLARNVLLPTPQLGDKIVLGHAGAYSRSMFSNFLGKNAPDEVFEYGLSQIRVLKAS